MSVAELIAALNEVEDRLELAQGQLARGRRSLGEAQDALARLDPEHPETVVPPGLGRADDQIERTQGLVEHTLDALRGFVTRL
ncbi:hypothetical protein HUO13_03560 [Saccharopolyspora erythraea]|uniref:hypothetical protein n=1 Tax=Saccharopolyspora erythraea TaxID=1836 RepID=UPI001BA662A1|nr:hypothetical protein [Saccharopolyspora erythraea]QUH00010.1 hypothetical protein HUO13_03560 [Saccharopolyspora erythraea]